MLPVSLRLLYALNNVTFQVSSLALLSIVNTRVGIPAEYLPAYGAISFLPSSLRPLLAWISSLILNNSKIFRDSKDRHDKLLFPSFLFASLSFVGTAFIPSGGIILCFFWGFMRGIASALKDFLLGMVLIEFSKLEVRSSFSEPSNKDRGTYEHNVSVNTAQSSTAQNIGSFLASIVTFAFFAKTGELGETVTNTVLLGTAAIFLFTSLVALKFQAHVSSHLADLNGEGYDPINNTSDAGSIPSTNFAYTSPSVQQSASEEVQFDASENSLTSPLLPDNGYVREESNTNHQRQIMEVSSLVAFQVLLAVSALQTPIIAISNQTTWLLLVVTSSIIIIVTIFLGYRYERQSKIQPLTLEDDRNERRLSQTHSVPQRRLNLYFLLRYSLPIASFVMSSYFYSVFESEPVFLQFLFLLQTAIGALAVFCYEKFLSPYCHSGWPFIGLTAGLDIIMGCIAFLDVWVIRDIREKEINGKYTIDNSLRYMVIVVGLIKYFFAEIDYMPAKVLSTTNIVHSEKNEVLYEYGDDDVPTTVTRTDADEEETGRASSLAEDFEYHDVSTTLNTNLDNEEDCSLEVATRLRSNSFMEDIVPSSKKSHVAAPVIMSAGMQYASFLSCIDFGAQIGDWITIPIVSSLGITRENHWDNIDKLVIICSALRMIRSVFLFLICPPIEISFPIAVTLTNYAKGVVATAGTTCNAGLSDVARLQEETE